MDTIAPHSKAQKKALAAVAVVAAGLVIAGCGNDSKADLVNGKELFVTKCGSCHTMARAETKGVSGPNLDDAFIRARMDGMGDETIAGVTERQIDLPSQDVAAAYVMPEDIVTGMDARDVGAYVGFAAGKKGEDTGALADAGKPKTPTRVAKADGSGKLQIDADPEGGTLFDAGTATAKAGLITLVMANPSSLPHNIAVKGTGLDEKGPVVNKGGTSEVKAELKPGKYTFYCSVPGHEAGGMKGELTVE